MPTLKEIRALYGADVIASRKGEFILVHLDRPSKAEVRRRTRTFNPVEFFCPDCPLCQMLKDGGIVVFDDSIADERDVLKDLDDG